MDCSSTSIKQPKPFLDLKSQKMIVKEAEMEFKLRGKFKRVFPTIDYPYYKQFFTEERPLNALLDEKIMSKRRIGNHVLIASTHLQQQPQFLPPLPQQIIMKQKQEHHQRLSQPKLKPIEIINQKEQLNRGGNNTASSTNPYIM